MQYTLFHPQISAHDLKSGYSISTHLWKQPLGNDPSDGFSKSDPDLLLQRIKDWGLPQEAFEWYIDLRLYGSVPHSGFGLGVERMTTWICGLDHLRETIAFPRMLNRVYP